MKKVSLLIAFAVMMWAGAVFAQETAEESSQETAASSVTVAESAVCIGISDRMPEGTASEFSKDTPKIYYWTKIEGAEGKEIKHIWYLGDTVISEVSLKVGSSSYRTWSSKTVYPGLEGDLSVAVVDEAGNEIKKDTFKIQ